MPKSLAREIVSKVQKVIDEFGRYPLSGTIITQKQALTATPEAVLAMVIDAMIKARPISHELTRKTIVRLTEAGYHDIETLSASTWKDRTNVLREGGYNRYNEQGATNLGELASLVVEKYGMPHRHHAYRCSKADSGLADGDLNNLLKKSNGQREKIRASIKEIKGLGDLAAEIFLDNAQSVWPSVAPFVDSRSLKTADEIGIGTDLDAIYTSLGRDPIEMSRFANGLSEVRLEKRQSVVEHI